MRILFDESLPNRLRRSLPNHSVRTVVEMGWSGTKNGKLLALAAAEFDVILTVDKNMKYQQNLKTIPIAIIVLDSVSNELAFLLPFIPKLEIALASLVSRSVVVIEA
jgi:predicted nuclease of predicted toxin-antitoxin system